MRTRKIACGILAAVTATLVLGGCGSEETAKENEAKKLTCWMPLVSNASMVVSNFGETELARELIKRTGVEVEFIHPPQGQESEKFSIIVSSSNLPDIIEYNWLNYPGGPAKAIKEGVIIDIGKHQDKAKNMIGYLNDNPEIKKLATTDANELFSFPFVRGDESLCFSSGLIVRGDWLKELGLEMPSTISEWETVLTAFRDKKGAATPYSADSTNNFAFAFDTTADYYLQDGKVKYGVLDESFKEYLATMNRWYQQGLIDPSFATLDNKTREANILNGVSGVTTGSVGSGIGKWMGSATSPGYSLEGAPVPVPQKGQRAKFGVYQLPVTSSLTAFDAISTSCKDVESAIKFLDYGYTEEGMMLYNFGIEGESYTMTDGYPAYTELITNNPDGLSMTVALAKYTRSYSTGPFVQDKRYMEQYAALPEQKRAWETWSDTDIADYSLPHLYMKDEELTEYAQLNNDINTYVEEMIAKFIIGAEPIESYDSMIQQLHSRGIDRVLEMKQAAYDRYSAK